MNIDNLDAQPDGGRATAAAPAEHGTLLEAAAAAAAAAAAPAGDAADPRSAMPELTDPSHYSNRELSLLQFNRRVLEEAEDPSNPLLERVKFLAIVDSNLDEFFMVRVAGLEQQIAAGVIDVSADGLPPAEQLAAVRKRAAELMKLERRCLREQILPALGEAGIHILDLGELGDKQTAFVKGYFEEFIYPVLTPLAFDPGRPFPFISNLSVNLAVILRDRQGEARFARIKVPSSLPSLVPLKRSSGGTRRDGTVPRNHYFVPIEQVIIAHLDALFPGMEIVEVHFFHVTRDAETEIQELEAADLLETIEKTVRRRRFGSVVRLTLNRGTPAHIRELLGRELGVDPKDVYELEGPLTLRGLLELYAIDKHELKDPSFKPALPAAFDAHRGGGGIENGDERGDIFSIIRRGDILLHHPFDSFEPVIDFLEAAARDADVLAIKITLYRVGRNSPVVDALLEALRNGKQVSALVELKARFDEESNIGWAKRLEKEGVHVVYGLLGLKTHSKVALVVRREGEHIRRYVHLSTGNYNHITAPLYTDLGLFTCDEAVGSDATDLFNYLTGYSNKADYRKLLLAPVNLRRQLTDLIRREIEHQRAGRGGHLTFKMNALVDRAIIRELYGASQAGVHVDLLVRGICCLRPGIPGVSDNIRVTSIVGRFLEHSRIYHFANAGDEQVYLGSADLMPRNIDGRVEVLFPVESRELVRQLRQEVLDVYLADNVKARRLGPDGKYVRLRPGKGEAAICSQEALLAARA